MSQDQFYPRHSAAFAALRPALAGRRIAVVGHARPDGDCIGSQVGLARMLAGWAAEVVCVNPDTVPRRLQFLVRDMKFWRTDDILPVAANYTAFFVDCADGARGGERLQAAFPRPFAMVDHHLSNDGFARHNFIDTGSAATSEILAGMLSDTGLPYDAQTAQALYTGILTDTGQFRFPSTSRRTFLLAAQLLDHGARPSEAGFELYERETPGNIQLLQRFLASFRMECGGRLCVGTLTRGVFAETGTTAEDTEGLVDYARSIDGVDVGVLIEERDDGSYKASLRSHDAAYRLDRIAALFNGGGHACAAGLNLKKDTANFRARLVAAIAARFAEVDAERKTQA
ncbi:MAG: bifunctional oligoribonuclease/PAP phosphatase NrnA [Opitutales bacterium]